MQDYEPEWECPDSVMVSSEKIFGNLLSIGEMLQWGVVLVVMYLVLTFAPGDTFLKLFLLGPIAVLAMGFIHFPINGYTGLQWIQINLNFRRDEKGGLHITRPVETGTSFGTPVELELTASDLIVPEADDNQDD